MLDQTAHFWTVRKTLRTKGDLILYGDWVVIPDKMKEEALDRLHGAHQGVTSLLRHAE